jgi:hypothetical protein
MQGVRGNNSFCRCLRPSSPWYTVPRLCARNFLSPVNLDNPVMCQKTLLSFFLLKRRACPLVTSLIGIHGILSRAMRIATTEVKFLDRCGTGGSEGALLDRIRQSRTRVCCGSAPTPVVVPGEGWSLTHLGGEGAITASDIRARRAIRACTSARDNLCQLAGMGWREIGRQSDEVGNPKEAGRALRSRLQGWFGSRP